MGALNSSHQEFGSLLKQWRSRRRLSQLELSLLSSTSTRHISFLEKGRSKPSREMVQKLALSLDVAPVEVNEALVAAGFAPLYPSAELNDDKVAVLKSVVRAMLEKHMPWPALACDAHWNVVDINLAGEHLMGLLGSAGASNVMDAMLRADAADGPFLNWPEVARLMLRRLNIEQKSDPENQTLQSIRAHLEAHPRINEDLKPDDSELEIVVPVKIEIDNTVLSFISMIAQFGAVQEITYSGVHVELFFPDDAVTTDYLESLPWTSNAIAN